jgi:hypothetical protein
MQVLRRLHGQGTYFKRTSRGFEAAIGALCGAVGAALCALGCFGLYASLARQRGALPPGAAIFLLILFGISALLLVCAWRLIFDRKRQDGGLLSPFGLRMGGVMFLSAPLLAVVTRDAGGLHHALFGLVAAGACFGLARHRERYLARGVPPDDGS